MSTSFYSSGANSSAAEKRRGAEGEDEDVKERNTRRGRERETERLK